MTHAQPDLTPHHLNHKLNRDLNALHESYIGAVNRAVTDGHLGLAEEIAASYDADVLDLVAARDTRGDAA